MASTLTAETNLVCTKGMDMTLHTPPHFHLRSFTAGNAAALGLALALLGPFGLASAQTTTPAASAPADAQCILAGRLGSNARWAPQARGIELLDAAGKRISSSDKAALGAVAQVRVTSPALLSACNGSQRLTQGEDLPKAAKASSPAVSAGNTPLKVESVSFPPLRVGGELVELRLSVGPDRVIALSR
jgi:hypothetical protein